MRSRGVLLGAVVALCVVGAVAYVVLASGQSDPAAAVLPPQPAMTPSAPGAKPLDPHLRIAVRAVSARDPRLPGRVYVVDPAHPGARQSRDLACLRVYSSAGHGICLYLAHSGVDYRAALLGPGYRVIRTMPITGVPSRTRISPDGRHGAITTFTLGDSYANAGQFSTRTSLVDMTKGRVIGDLEQFTVLEDGRVTDAPDHNFWGVTFARDGDTFYATLATAGHHWLVRGSIRARRVTILRDAVECPSLSPDGTRIAFKKTLGKGRWRLSVLDLRTLRDAPLAERRSIDDQAEWLDDAHVAYGDGTDVWEVPADGSGAPVRLIRGAQSPVALRG